MKPIDYLTEKKTFYRKRWQQNGYYPIEKFVWGEQEKGWEHFVQKTSGWKSWGCNTIEWWQYIFENNENILSYKCMQDNNNYNEE